MDGDLFVFADKRPRENPVPIKKEKWYQGNPVGSVIVLAVVVLGCMGCDWFALKDPAFMDLKNCSVMPGRLFWFGTDVMGRDIFSGIWYGGRISLFIGFASTVISTGMAVVIGSVSGMAPPWLDEWIMRFAEIFMSVPGLLLIILLQAVLGDANVVTLSLVIGITGWTAMAKVVRTEVRRLRGSEYVIASRCMGGGFFYILWKHLAPNFVSSIMFMVVMNIRSGIVAESTLSFMGIGLPLEILSWGSMLSLSERALLGGEWWMIVIPGAFLVTTLLCVTNIGNYLRREGNRRESCL